METIERIMKLEGATTVAELAAKLEIPKGTIDTWKNRKRVPIKVLREWSIKYGKSIGWFNGDDSEEKENPLESDLRRLVSRLTDELISEAKTPQDEMDLIEEFMAFRRDLRKKREP